MINTERLIIKPWTEADAESFFHLTSDQGFRLFPITNYEQTSIDSAREWIRKNPHKFAVIEKSTNTIIGMGGLTPWTFDGEEMIDITYRLRESAWGKGYGWETAKALRDYGFQQLKLKEITATITPDNIPSKKIAEKLGLKFAKKIILLGVETELYRLGRPISSPTNKDFKLR